ncbi:hypothetical protein B566_EDAN015059 [Ephemera danica]|nr:hypothetical protein B566_EDAN015059 [Ephemera danica]
MTISELVSGLSDNPYFGAGFGLFGLGAGAAILRRGLQGATILFRRHYMMTLEVPCRDKSYQWLLQWITLKGARKTQHLSVETSFEQRDSGHVKTKYDFIPSIGSHFFRYNGTWIKVERTREQHTLDLHMGVPWETVTLTAFGRDKSLYFNILEDAKAYSIVTCLSNPFCYTQTVALSPRQMALQQHEGKIIMYTAVGSEWRQFGHARRKRPISSVVLDEGVAERIVKDVREFVNNPSWYTERAIFSINEHRLKIMELSVCVMNLSERGLSDDRLAHLLAVAPVQSLLLLEDVDAAFGSREDTSQAKAAYEGLNRVTFSGLLNCLDGVASTEARILFMTTNYLERLDPALIRPGRVDVKEYVGYCSAHQVRRMFLRFYPGVSEHMAAEFAANVMAKKKPVSPAMLQGFFMFHKGSASDVMTNIDQIWTLM